MGLWAIHMSAWHTQALDISSLRCIEAQPSLLSRGVQDALHFCLQTIRGDRSAEHAQTVSTMLQRYFTPASGALAVAAVQRAVAKESQRQNSILNADGTPVPGADQT